MATKTLKVRVRDKHAKVLAAQARAVNFVWNYLNELSSRSIRERGKFLSAFDMHAYTTGASKELDVAPFVCLIAIQDSRIEYTLSPSLIRESICPCRVDGSISSCLP